MDNPGPHPTHRARAHSPECLSGSDTPIAATFNDPFWVDERGWVQAGQFVSGDRLMLGQSTGPSLEILEVADLGDVQHQIVQNLSVAGSHTFYVVSGAGDLLVHNRPTPRMGAQIRAVGLPTKGSIRFVPPKRQTVLQPLKKSGGYRTVLATCGKRVHLGPRVSILNGTSSWGKVRRGA